MSDQVTSAIDVLVSKVTAKEAEINSLKRLINGLCVEENLPIRYEHITEASQGISNLRSDHFYGQALTTAVRNYLEMRKSAGAGPATVNEIFKAIREGGYKSETKDEENAKNTLRIALRKNSSIFHKLPNGEFGLLAWYPNAKEQPKEDGEGESSKAPSKKVKAEKAGNFITNEQIRNTIFKMPGNFQASDIEAIFKRDFPSKELRDNAIPTAIFHLKKKGFLTVIAERHGAKGATYAKAK